MRRLTILVIVAACLYSLYWLVGATRIESGAKDALAQLSVDGWTVSQSDLATRGYPSRFDTTVTDLSVMPPDGSWQYQTPFAQAFALSYRPTNLIVALADQQQLRIADQIINIASDELRASGSVAAGADLSLKDVTIAAAILDFSSNYGWQVGVEEALIAIRPSTDTAQSYDLYVGANKLQPSQGAALTSLKFDSAVQLDRALDRHLINDTAPQITQIEVKTVTLTWDRIQLNGAGVLTVDHAGVPFGEIIFKTKNWQDLAPLLTASGIISPQFQIMVMTMLQNLAGADGSLALPLRFEGGAMQLGPFPLGPAPRLR